MCAQSGMRLISLILVFALATGLFLFFEPVQTEGGQYIMMPDVCSKHDAAPSMDMPAITPGSLTMAAPVIDWIVPSPVAQASYQTPRLSEDKPPRS